MINAFAQKQPPGSRAQVIWYRSAGLREATDVLSHTHTRGLHAAGATLLHVLDQRVYAITKSGETYSFTNLGALTGTDAVTIAQNNAATPNIVAVSLSSGAWNLFTGSAPTPFADTDLPQPNSVAMLNGYLLFTIGDGRIFASDLNSVSVASNSTATEQGLTLRRGVVFADRYYAFGDKWTGVYRDIGASPFPLERQLTIPRGLVGTYAIAGFEKGWANQLIWAADDFIVYRMEGYTPVPISNDDVSRDIETAVKAEEGALLEAYVYMSGKNAFWVLTNPGVWTWEHNLTTGEWNERQSYHSEDCRIRQSVRAFDRWIVGDKETGKLAEIDSTYAREFDDPLIWEISSGNSPTFPSRGTVPRVDFDFTNAVGMASGEDPIQTDPSAQISFSKDGGGTWGNPLIRRLGVQGATDQKISVLRVGKFDSRGVRAKLRISDPVHVGFQGGVMAIEQRAE